ncbi:MAG: FprA family A-type flavoprotein [Victivallales bacterium]|nr:FprA family A-type flavoprotein [Victivallales bacterium]
MANTKLRKNIHWIGVVDWDVRDFHGYTTKKGSTYNSYIIKDTKTAVIDSVKAPFADELIDNILKHTEFEKIDYIICNHAEPDHSGSISVLMDLCPNAELVCNPKCRKTLSKLYNTDSWNFKTVNEGDKLSLGKHTLTFVNTPMAHWPESMMTYVIEEKILFSMDAFGQHYATSGRFDTEEPLNCALDEAKKYYANIIMLYGKPVTAAMKKASTLDIDIIAPSHGIIWTKHIPEIINRYKDWTVCKPTPKVLIFFDTMWRSTAMMADAIYKGADIPGVEVKKFDLKYTNITDIATETLDAAVLAVGSPTLNKGLMPKVAEHLTYLKGLAPKDKSAIAFGAYGWAKKGGQHKILEYLKEMNCEILKEEPVQSNFVPTDEKLQECREVGKMLAEKAIEAK